MNKKTTKKNTKKTTKKTAPKYTRLTAEEIVELVEDATTNLIQDAALDADICEAFEFEEYEDAAGTFFIEYEAKTWRDAAAFNAAMIGQAFASGYFAEASARWEDDLAGGDGRRRVSVFVAAADYMDDDGHAK